MAENSSYREASSDSSEQGVLTLTARVVSAHVSNNTVPADALPGLIQQVFQALRDAYTGPAPEAAAPARPMPAERPRPAVSVSKSVFADYIVCLEDGKKLKMLKRHLKTAYDMTPEQYRVRWELEPDYPMVAPDYAKKRSSLAKASGLGTRPRQTQRI